MLTKTEMERCAYAASRYGKKGPTMDEVIDEMVPKRPGPARKMSCTYPMWTKEKGWFDYDDTWEASAALLDWDRWNELMRCAKSFL